MATTNFIDKQTVIQADWLNDVDATVYGLPAAGGAGLVGYLPAGTGAVATTVQGKLRESVSVFDFMTSAEITDVTSHAATIDVSSKINAALTYANNVARTSVFLPGGTYRVGSTIVVGAGTLEGVGAWSDTLLGPTSRLQAATVGMTVITCTAVARLKNFAIQGGNLANIGIRFDGGPRQYAENIEVVRCKKTSFLLAQTQNSCFTNLCSRFSVRAFTLANGARNNNFYNCTSEVNQTYFDPVATGVPFENTCGIYYVIDTTDADYGATVTTGGNDRNNWFGGIHERFPCGIRFSNLSGYALAESIHTNFYGVELTPGQGTAPLGVLDTSGSVNPGVIRFDAGAFILKDQDSPFSTGSTGLIHFTGEQYMSGANNLARRGISQNSNYHALFRIDTANAGIFATTEGGGAWTVNTTTGEISMTSGNAVQGVQLSPFGSGFFTNSTANATMAGPKGFTAKAVFTITEVIGGFPVLVYVPLNGSPFRRQVGSYALAGTYTLDINMGANVLDMFMLSFTNNGNTSVKVKNITMRAA
jgi:hypothetical protein